MIGTFFIAYSVFELNFDFYLFYGNSIESINYIISNHLRLTQLFYMVYLDKARLIGTYSNY
jgi:hypothetical protein